MSDHSVEVVPVVLEPHPNADSLSLVRVWGFVCVVRTTDFQGITLAAYVPPDSLVDATRPEFSFLAKKANKVYNGKTWARITVCRLRGALSQGLLLPAKPHWKLGDNVAEELGVEHYEPPIQMFGPGSATDAESAPGELKAAPKYDVENWRKYEKLFIPGEPVAALEKVHGANSRYAFRENRIWCGSRTGWKKEDPKSPWWIALRRHPELEEFCKNNPTLIVYGEIYGAVQTLKYGATQEDPVRFVAFDILDKQRWLEPDEAREVGQSLPWVPKILWNQPYNRDEVEKLAEGPSLFPGANHIREGIVIKPMKERIDIKHGRVQLKIVSDAYLALS